MHFCNTASTVVWFYKVKNTCSIRMLNKAYPDVRRLLNKVSVFQSSDPKRFVYVPITFVCEKREYADEDSTRSLHVSPPIVVVVVVVAEIIHKVISPSRYRAL